MTACEYFAAVADAVRSRRAAELLLVDGPPSTGERGGSSQSSGGPVFARAASDERAERAIAQADAVIGEALEYIAGLRRLYCRKADVLELRYIDLLKWDDVAFELGVSLRTAQRWHDELMQWVDSVGWAHAKAGTGIAEM